jgi:signal transduction histidine kinase
MSNEGLDESTIQFLQMAEVSVTRLDGTIQEILEYSRNSRLGIEQVEVNIERLIYEIFDDLRFSNDKVHQWNVHVECQGDVMTDKARLKVLLRNIIGNSVKYSRQGEINQVEVRVYQMDRRLCFEVKDNGEGISKESISRVFEMFYRGTSNSQGTGLGLYICKEIISKMKGEIKIESELGKGTSVYFWIPYLS